MSEQSTPRPWRRGQIGNLRIYGPDGTGDHSGPVAEAMHRRLPEEQAANAQLIMRAVNAHDALVAALELLLADVQDYEAWQRPCHAVDVARAALAKARGEQ